MHKQAPRYKMALDLPDSVVAVKGPEAVRGCGQAS